MLQRLHQELEQPGGVSDTERQQLQELMGDIERVLAEDQPQEEHHGVGDRVTDAVERFEQSHPNIAFALRRVVDALGRMGI